MKKTILVLSSNPSSTADLFSGRELNVIRDCLEKNKAENLFNIEVYYSLTKSDLVNALRRSNPYIVHFIFHSDSENVFLESFNREAESVCNNSILNQIINYKNTIKAVVINSCNSMKLASLLSKEINFVVGTIDKIKNQEAISYSDGFYSSLFLGRSVLDSHDQGNFFAYNKKNKHMLLGSFKETGMKNNQVEELKRSICRSWNDGARMTQIILKELDFAKNGLNEIDEIWLSHSNNKFGISVQYNIWKSICNKKNLYLYSDMLFFAKTVGWLDKNYEYGYYPFFLESFIDFNVLSVTRKKNALKLVVEKISFFGCELHDF